MRVFGVLVLLSGAQALKCIFNSGNDTGFKTQSDLCGSVSCGQDCYGDNDICVSNEYTHTDGSKTYDQSCGSSTNSYSDFSYTGCKTIDNPGYTKQIRCISTEDYGNDGSNADESPSSGTPAPTPHVLTEAQERVMALMDGRNTDRLYCYSASGSDSIASGSKTRCNRDSEDGVLYGCQVVARTNAQTETTTYEGGCAALTLPPWGCDYKSGRNYIEECEGVTLDDGGDTPRYALYNIVKKLGCTKEELRGEVIETCYCAESECNGLTTGKLNASAQDFLSSNQLKIHESSAPTSSGIFLWVASSVLFLMQL